MILLDDQQILDCVEQSGLRAALERAFRHPAPTPQRMHIDLPGSDGAKLLIMPCCAERDLIGVKLVSVIPTNSAQGRPTVDGVYAVMDGRTGQPLAILSARALTAVRTASVCALAASRLSRAESSHLLVVGTGALVPHLVRAYRAVRALDRVSVWGRDQRKAGAAVAGLTESGIAAQVAPDLAGAVATADIICCATLSRTPLIRGRDVVAGTHIDLVGSFTPQMREADTALFRRGRLVVDTAMAFSESGDLIGPLAEGAVDPSMPDLTRLLRSSALDRTHAADITIFKTVGTGLADLAAARYILERTGAAQAAQAAQAGPLLQFTNSLQLDKIS